MILVSRESTRVNSIKAVSGGKWEVGEDCNALWLRGEFVSETWMAGNLVDSAKKKTSQTFWVEKLLSDYKFTPLK